MMHRFFPFLLTAVATATFAGDVKEDARTFL
jgi:hypothetical protein